AARVEKLAVLVVVGQQQGAEVRPASGWLGPANNNELLAVQALHFEPEAPIARNVRPVDPLRDDAFDAQAAGLLVKTRAVADNMIAKSQPRDRAGEQCPQPLLALDERQFGHAARQKKPVGAGSESADRPPGGPHACAAGPPKLCAAYI